MSHVEIRKLKGIRDTTIKWDTIPFPFTIAVEQHDFLQEFDSYVIGYRVINDDVLSSLSYRQDQLNKQQIVLGPSSLDEQSGWTSLIQVTPDPVSGSGTLEVDLVPREIAELRRRGR